MTGSVQLPECTVICEGKASIERPASTEHAVPLELGSTTKLLGILPFNLLNSKPADRRAASEFWKCFWGRIYERYLITRVLIKRQPEIQSSVQDKTVWLALPCTLQTQASFLSASLVHRLSTGRLRKHSLRVRLTNSSLLSPHRNHSEMMHLWTRKITAMHFTNSSVSALGRCITASQLGVCWRGSLLLLPVHS